MPLLKLKIYTFEKKIEFLDELTLAASSAKISNQPEI